jgi:hypothetical protein
VGVGLVNWLERDLPKGISHPHKFYEFDFSILSINSLKMGDILK